MSISAFQNTEDFVIGTDDPLYENTWDNVAMDIQAALTVEHTAADARHSFGTTTSGLCALVTDTFSGDANTDQQIAVSGMTVLAVQLWDETDTVPVIATATMPDGEAKPLDDSEFSDQYIKSLDEDSFTVTEDGNVNGRTYYYTAWGLITPEGNGNSFTPSWIQDGEDIEVDESSDGPPTRAVKQILTRYQAEHEDDGTHKDAAFSGIGKIAVGGFVGDCTDGQVVTLASMTLKRLLLLTDAEVPPIVQTADMSGVKELDNTAIDTEGYITFGSEQFTINKGDSLAQATVLYLESNTYDGDPNIVDSSIYGHTITKVLNGGVVQHKTTISAVGASSISTDPIAQNNDTHMQIAHHDAFVFGGDFRIAFYARIINDYTTFCKGSARTSSKSIAIRYNSGKVEVYLDGTLRITSTSTWGNTTWRLVELVRVDGTVTLYVDSGSEGTYDTEMVFNNEGDMNIGAFENGTCTNCYIDEIIVENHHPLNFYDQTYYYVVFGE